jgi:hypothetical protein
MKVNESIDKALAKIIAEKIVGELDGPKRDEILAKGVAEALDDYTFKNAVEALVTKRAQVLIEKRLESGDFDTQILKVFEKSFANLLKALSPAVQQTLLEALCGKTGDRSYDEKPGILLKHMSKFVEKK